MLTLPLLWRQLALEASHGRTFWVRPLFGLVLAGCLVLASGATGMQLLHGEGLAPGAGRALFDALIAAACIAVFAGLPALIAPAIAAEDERGTLDLLRIAGIGPLALIIQLAGARLVMALTVALAALPLGALAYACGGVSDQRLAAAGLVLVVSAMQVAACAAAVGARRLPSAMAATAAYRAVIVHLLIILPLACGLLSLALRPLGLDAFGWPWSWYGALAAGAADRWLTVGAGLVPALVGITWHLLVAHQRMQRRSTELPPTQSFLMQRWRPAAQWQRSVRRWRLQHGLDRGELAQGDALAWRSQLYAPLVGSRRQNSRLRLYGCLLPPLCAIAVINALLVLHRNDTQMTFLQGCCDILFAIALALAMQAAATALPRERAAGTLAVLATTPLGAADLARGLSAGADLLLRRTLIAYACVMGFCALVEFSFVAWAKALSAVAAAAALAGAARWGGLLLGSRLSQPLVAGAASWAVLAGVLLLPWLVGRAAHALGAEAFARVCSALSPWHLTFSLHLDDGWPDAATSLAIVCWLLLWAGLRWLCHVRMERWLGRCA